MTDRSPPSRWWAPTALIPLVLFVAVGTVPDVSDSYLVRLYFAGDPTRWVDAAAAADVGEARLALALDLAFALSFAVVGFFVLRAGHRHWAPERRGPARGGRWIWKYMPIVAVTAGTLDLVETGGQLAWLESTDPPTVATHLIAAVAWWKWAAYLVAMVGLLGLVIGPITAPFVRPLMLRVLGDAPIPRTHAHVPCVHGIGDDGECLPDPAVDPDATRPDTEEVLGITVSGGGIRSASVIAGALRGLAADGTFQRARYLHAVSGGGFTAGGWRASSHYRTQHGGDPSGEPELDLFGADHPWFTSVRNRLNYLDNGVASLLGGIVNVVVRVVVVLGSIVWAAMLTGWIAGWLTQSWAVVPGFDNAEGGATAFDDLVAWRLVLPGLIPGLIATVILVSSLAISDRAERRRAWSIAAIPGVLGASLLVLLVAIPMGIWVGRRLLSLFETGSAESNVAVFGLVSTAGLVGAIWKVLHAELKKRWSRLGGVFLLLVLFLLAGKVADDRANDMRFFSGVWVPIVAVVWLVVTDVVPSHRLTLNGVYRKRLAGTFVLGCDPCATMSRDPRREPIEILQPLTDAEEPEWSAYTSAAGPELVLCGTAQSTNLQHGGLPALGFAFRPSAVSLYDETAGQPDSPYEPGSGWEGYPRRWTVSRSMALVGAAVSSAMGRQSFGSTNMLLSAVNLRLGMWLPNPNRRTWFREEHPPPRVHIGYFVKELFNRYDPDDDAFVYVTDGGHRDNLGFVEQLRERPDRMIVLDASGDQRGGFGTMRQAIALADVELHAQVDIDWEPLTWRDHDVPADCVTTGTATFRDGSEHVTRLIYAKAQVSDVAPPELRRFAASDPRFPDYSTGDQYLSTEEFDQLVAVGEHMAARIRRFIH